MANAASRVALMRGAVSAAFRPCSTLSTVGTGTVVIQRVREADGRIDDRARVARPVISCG